MWCSATEGSNRIDRDRTIYNGRQIIKERTTCNENTCRPIRLLYLYSILQFITASSYRGVYSQINVDTRRDIRSAAWYTACSSAWRCGLRDTTYSARGGAGVGTLRVGGGAVAVVVVAKGGSAPSGMV